jgi:hypothetical protein
MQMIFENIFVCGDAGKNTPDCNALERFIAYLYRK